MKKLLITVLKTALTIGIFVSLFVEFGGGTVPVSRTDFADGAIFYRANPAMPGFIGRMKARITGAELPVAQISLEASAVCEAAIEGAPVFVRSTSGEIVKFRALHHCVDGTLAQVLPSEDAEDKVALAATTGETVWEGRQAAEACHRYLLPKK